MDNKSFRNLLIMLLVAVLFILPASLTFYSKQHAFPKAPKNDSYFANQALLTDTLPQDIVDVTGKVINNYINGGTGSLTTTKRQFDITSKVVIDAGNYQFLVKPVGGGKTLNVRVFVDTSGGIPAVTIWINNELQPAAV